MRKKRRITTAAPEETVEDVDIAELTEGAEALDEDEGDIRAIDREFFT